MDSIRTVSVLETGGNWRLTSPTPVSSHSFFHSSCSSSPIITQSRRRSGQLCMTSLCRNRTGRIAHRVPSICFHTLVNMQARRSGQAMLDQVSKFRDIARSRTSQFNSLPLAQNLEIRGTYPVPLSTCLNPLAPTL